MYVIKKDPAASISDRNEHLFIIRLTAITLLITLLISWRLYLPGFRVFLSVPLLDMLHGLPYWVDWTVTIACMMCLISLAVFPRKRALAGGVLFCLAVGVLQDVNRLNPYICMYSFPLITAFFCRDNKDHALDALRIMICGVYFWAGFHKLNATFYNTVFPWFISPIHQFSLQDPGTLDYMFGFGLLITPVFEAMIGILLLFPKYRRVATVMAFIMLVTVLVCLGPLGHNWGKVVWPWNIYLFMMEYLLFWKFPDKTNAPFFVSRQSYISRVGIALYVIAPVLAIFSPWYSYPGFKLYSGNIVRAEVLLAPEETMSRVPDYIASLRVPDKLDVGSWSVHELGNMPYPAPYVLRTGAAGLCAYLDEPGQTQLRMIYPSPFYSQDKEYEDMPLCP